jgi:hypothetical protein
MEERLFADVEYFERVYHDVELIAGIWYFYDSFGTFSAFVAQWRVRLVNEPQPTPRHIRRSGSPPTIGSLTLTER